MGSSSVLSWDHLLSWFHYITCTYACQYVCTYNFINVHTLKYGKLGNLLVCFNALMGAQQFREEMREAQRAGSHGDGPSGPGGPPRAMTWLSSRVQRAECWSFPGLQSIHFHATVPRQRTSESRRRPTSAQRHPARERPKGTQGGGRGARARRQPEGQAPPAEGRRGGPRSPAGRPGRPCAREAGTTTTTRPRKGGHRIKPPTPTAPTCRKTGRKPRFPTRFDLKGFSSYAESDTLDLYLYYMLLTCAKWARKKPSEGRQRPPFSGIV